MGSAQSFDERVRAHVSVMSKSQRQIAAYMTDQSNAPALQTAATIAREVGVSEATVVRFAQALGYSGYPEMQRSMQQALMKDVTTVKRLESTLREAGSPMAVLERCLSRDASALEVTRSGLDSDQLEAAVEVLTRASSIYVVGHLMAFPAAHLLWQGLMMIGLRASLLDWGGVDAHLQLQRAGADDVMVSVAMRRYNAATVAAVEAAAELGMARVAITDDILSPTAVRSTYVLLAAPADEGFFQSTTAATSLVDGLLTACSVRRPEEARLALGQLEERWQRGGAFHPLP